MPHVFYWWLASVLALAVSYAIFVRYPEWSQTQTYLVFQLGALLAFMVTSIWNLAELAERIVRRF
jgi:hypothetical protein